jgi:hypothetical protein
MRKVLLIVVLISILVTPPVLGDPGKGSSDLIKVTPSYHKASYVQAKRRPNPYVANQPSPRPRDQLYVFWLLGKALSYPIDRTESYIAGLRARSAAKTTTKPAVSPTTNNPFLSRNLHEIPPAPPVLDELTQDRDG